MGMHDARSCGLCQQSGSSCMLCSQSSHSWQVAIWRCAVMSRHILGRCSCLCSTVSRCNKCIQAGVLIQMPCLQAAILTGRRSKTAVSLAEVDDSVDRIVAGMEGTPMVDSKSKSLVAYHEVGHAVCGTLTPGKLRTHQQPHSHQTMSAVH